MNTHIIYIGTKLLCICLVLSNLVFPTLKIGLSYSTMSPRVVLSWNPGFLYHSLYSSSCPRSLHLTGLKSGSALLDSFHVNGEGRIMVICWLMDYPRADRGFSVFLSPAQLWFGIPTIFHTGYIFPVCFSCRKDMCYSNTTSVAACMPKRLITLALLNLLLSGGHLLYFCQISP